MKFSRKVTPLHADCGSAATERRLLQTVTDTREIYQTDLMDTSMTGSRLHGEVQSFLRS
jgi:hypothetical protein